MPTTLLSTSDEVTIREVLSRELPDLQIKTCSIVTSGWDNVVVEVNDEWIFRFPRNNHMAEIVDREIELLKLLALVAIMPIPKYEFFGKEVVMVGYRKLQGQYFFGQDYRTLSVHDKQKIAESLAFFMYQMHNSLSVSEARTLGYIEYNPPLDVIEAKLLGSFLSQELDCLIQEAIDCARQHQREITRLAFIHNDLHGKNMVYDPIAKKIVGIFDFSDAVIADFAIEFSKLFLIDADLAERTSQEYSRLTGAREILRIAAADCIIRSATYLLEYIETGNNAIKEEIVPELAASLPIWEKMKNTAM